MKKLLIFCLIFGQINAQDFKRHFVNMTEAGIIAGHVVYDYSYWTWGGINQQKMVGRRISPTIQTFNGVQLNSKLAVGVTTGIDLYNAAMLVPVAVGLRHDLLKHSSKKVGLFGSFDGGYSLSMQPNASNYDVSGGVMANPAVGLRFGMKSKTAFILTFGYKHQRMHIDKTPTNATEEYRYEDRRYNRFSLRLGFAF